MPVPFDRPTFDQIMHSLKTAGEAGDILCKHAAEEIERLQQEVAFCMRVLKTLNAVHAIQETMPPPPLLTEGEKKAIKFCIFQQSIPQKVAVVLRSFLERLRMEPHSRGGVQDGMDEGTRHSHS
jgi:hypothetical protein